MDPYPRTWAEIDLGALRRNLAAVKRQLPEGVLTALVCKADGYGHGLVPTGRFAAKNGADWLAVATVQEGVALREAGVQAPVMVMSPVLAVEADQAVFYGLDVFVESAEMVLALGVSGRRLGREVDVHLKVDTGLHRFGCHPDGVLELGRAIVGEEGVRMAGVCQHFVDSAFDEEATLRQRAVFRAVLGGLRSEGIDTGLVHEANSAGAVRMDGETGLVRVGIFAYGYDPGGRLREGLEPVMRWRARVTSVRSVRAGEGVGYSSTCRLEKDSRIATLGVGYGDGYDRGLSNQGFVSIRGRRCAVVGLVCMDQILVDVTESGEVRVGEVAELVGPECPATELARLAGTNAHEILCRVMSRVSRRYVYPE